jgi:hypothetical protein
VSITIVDATKVAACDLMHFYRFVQPSTGIAASFSSARVRIIQAGNIRAGVDAA